MLVLQISVVKQWNLSPKNSQTHQSQQRSSSKKPQISTFSAKCTKDGPPGYKFKQRKTTGNYVLFESLWFLEGGPRFPKSSEEILKCCRSNGRMQENTARNLHALLGRLT